VHRSLVGKPEEKDHSEDISVDGKTIVGRLWTVFIWLRIGISGGSSVSSSHFTVHNDNSQSSQLKLTASEEVSLRET
jgi:hypothetical protein